jgi:hypothetical protein
MKTTPPINRSGATVKDRRRRRIEDIGVYERYQESLDRTRL